MRQPISGNKFGIYIHVPFCRQPRCAYCDFYSTPADEQRIGLWYKAVIAECRQAREQRFDSDWIVGSLFFGGGTPSLLNPSQLGELIELVRECWDLAHDVEITVECNPEDLSADWAAFCLEVGVNRLSVGVQSFDPEYLAAIGRCHRSGRAEQALIAARNVGISRVSADLILGGPGSNVNIVVAGVKRALDLGVEHLSVYGYHLDPPADGFGNGKYRALNDDAWSAQYLAVCEILASKGWRHYEISNWARDDAALCSHNLFYWRRLPYLGLGPSAHSFSPSELRTSNHPDLDAWLRAAQSGNFSTVRDRETLDGPTILFERVMLGLRLDDGVELELLKEIHGPDVICNLEVLTNKGLARMDEERLRLTCAGFLLYDSLAVELVP